MSKQTLDPETKIDVLISDVPMNVYKEIRKQMVAQGYHTQGFESWETSRKEVGV